MRWDQTRVNGLRYRLEGENSMIWDFSLAIPMNNLGNAIRQHVFWVVNTIYIIDHFSNPLRKKNKIISVRLG